MTIDNMRPGKPLNFQCNGKYLLKNVIPVECLLLVKTC